MGGLFGGTKETSHSGNYAYDSIKGSTEPLISGGNNAFDMLRAFTSGGSVNGQTATQAYSQTPGYQTALDSGVRAIGSSQAAKGLLNSGSTLKGITKYGEDLGTQYYQQLLDNLFKQSSLGVTAQGVLSDAGKYTDSTRTTSPGIGGLLGGLLLTAATGGLGGLAGLGGAAGAGAAGSAAGLAGAGFTSLGNNLMLAPGLSDRRLKKDIVKIGELEDGLGLYEWQYTFKKGRHRGVMADEVEKLRPWALGPRVEGYATVNYNLLEDVDAS